MKPLFLVLKKYWYGQIALGEKSVEYRQYNSFWRNRLDGKEFENVVFQLGYSKNAPQMKFAIDHIDIGDCPFSKGKYFRIHFDSSSMKHIIPLTIPLQTAFPSINIEKIDEK